MIKQEKLKVKTTMISQLHTNIAWKKYLDSFPNQHDKDVAAMTMNWITEKYPRLIAQLDYLIAKLSSQVEAVRDIYLQVLPKINIDQLKGELIHEEILEE